MKKKSRFLTGLLSAVMALSLFAMPAAAAGEDDTPAAASVSDNWTQSTGSIVIHKYEYNGNEEIDGTGENTDKLPTDETPKALEGAGFTVYKVMDRSDLAKYYDGYSTSAKVTVGDYTKNGAILSAYADKKVGDEVKTGSDGIARFTGLELGLYVVVETTAPDKVTKTVDPFLVSIPMTKASNNKEWLYNVDVYPKNKTTYGAVSLAKTGRTGEKDDGALAGVTFILQKKVNGEWETIDKPDNSDKKFDLTTDAKGMISIDGLSKGEYRFIESSIAGDNSYIIDEQPIEFEITETGKLKYKGVETSDSITVVNDKPDLVKNVVNKNGANGKDADYSIGDLVPYKITVTVPKNITRLATFNVVDTPTNLDDKWNDASFTVKLGDTEVAKDAYKVEKSGEHGFKVTFDPSKMEAYEGKDIVISYNAELLSAANTTVDGNPNTAKLEYTSRITIDENGKPTEPPTDGKKEIEDDAVVYSFKLKVYKTADDTNAALAGVKFDLYKEDKENGTVTGSAAKALGLDKDKKWTKINSETLTTDGDGVISQNGLSNGTYYLVEVETAEGYNLLKAPVEVKLNIEYQTNWKITEAYDDKGNLTKYDVDQKETTFTNNSDKDTSEIYVVNVINRKGFDLPVTGGFGTLLFSGIGALLVVGGVGVLMSTKKKKGNA